MQGDLLGATIFLDSSLICNWMPGPANFPQADDDTVN